MRVRYGENSFKNNETEIQTSRFPSIKIGFSNFRGARCTLSAPGPCPDDDRRVTSITTDDVHGRSLATDGIAHYYCVCYYYCCPSCVVRSVNRSSARCCDDDDGFVNSSHVRVLDFSVDRSQSRIEEIGGRHGQQNKNINKRIINYADNDDAKPAYDIS